MAVVVRVEAQEPETAGATVGAPDEAAGTVARTRAGLVGRWAVVAMAVAGLAGKTEACQVAGSPAVAG